MAMLYGMMGKLTDGDKEKKIKELAQYKTREKLTLPSVRGKKAKVIILTEKGEKKAKELLLLNTDTVSKLNNKET